MKVNGIHYRTVWFEEGTVCLIDQPRLPHQFEIVRLTDFRETARSITTMVVRGAGAIGATAGFAMAQGILQAPDDSFQPAVASAADTIRATRPTAHNLFYAVERVLSAIACPAAEGDLEQARKEAVVEAQRIADEDALACERIGQEGLKLIPPNARISTHCNAGWLAFVDWGSALSPIFAAHRAGLAPSVYVDETRPRSQGARLTAWELTHEQVPFQLLVDGAVASIMRRGGVQLAIVGSDRIARNGDVANKIGTYPLALAASAAGIPFYVAAPSSTIDADCPSGDHIPIEHRSEEEVLWVPGRTPEGSMSQVLIAPEGATALNPAFDVTPASLVAGIITEFGVFKACEKDIRAVLEHRERAYLTRASHA